MNFFPFLRLGIIKKLKENVVLIRKSKIMIFECAVTCYRTLFIMTDIKTNTMTMTKTKTKVLKTSTYAIFLKSRGYKDIKYDSLPPPPEI